MSKVFESGRQTGRTTRLLISAIGLANIYTVAVVAVDENHAAWFRDRLNQLSGGSHNVRVVTAKHVDPSTMTLPRDRDCLLLFDHYTIEKMYGRVLNAYHAFDKDNFNYEGLTYHE